MPWEKRRERRRRRRRKRRRRRRERRARRKRTERMTKKRARLTTGEITRASSRERRRKIAIHWVKPTMKGPEERAIKR